MAGYSLLSNLSQREFAARRVATAGLAALTCSQAALAVFPQSAMGSQPASSYQAYEPVTSEWLEGPSLESALNPASVATFRARLTSAVSVTTRFVLVSVRDAAGRSFDLARTDNVRLDSSGAVISASKSFPIGQYSYRVGYRGIDGLWHNLGEVRRFTVTPAPSHSRWSMGYFVGYLHRRYPLDLVNWNALTHMAVGAAIPRDDGSLDMSFFQDAVKGPAWAKSVVAAAHEHRRKAVLMVGGAGFKDGFLGALTEINRSRFVQNLLNVVDEYGFDGIDIDLEPLTEADGPQLMALARELRTVRPGLTLTIPVGTVNMNRLAETQLTYLRSLPQYFDQINIMSYGMAHTWRGWSSWHTTPLSGHTQSTPMSVASSIQTYLETGIPASKLGMGLGLYGACFQGVTGPNQVSSQMTKVADDNKMSQANVMTYYYRPSALKWDAVAQVPYLSSAAPLGPLACNFIPFEDSRSVALKLQHASTKGLGGLIIWNINEGYISPETGRDEILRTIEQSGYLG